MKLLWGLRSLYLRLFTAVDAAVGAWLPGLAARLVFSSVLLAYFWTAGLRKVGDGVLGFFTVTDGAYAQILPPIAEAAGYDSTQIAFIPWGLVVFVGTYSELILPLLIALGLFTRIAAIGMTGFVFVQTYVDIAFHGADATTVGMMFDRIHNSEILDSRLLWLFPLLYLVLRGPGVLSLDGLLGRVVRPPDTA